MCYTVGYISIKEEIKRFEIRFRKLRLAALDDVCRKEVQLTDFRRELKMLPSEYTHENRIITENSSVDEAVSIEKIFEILNRYYSYIDFSLLKHIIDCFCSERLKKDMSDYEQDITIFKERTTISDALKYLPKSPERREPPPGFTSFTVKFDFNPESATLQQLDDHRKTFANEFMLSSLAFHLFELKKGCLQVTWLVSTEFEPIIRSKAQGEAVLFLCSNKILKLLLGENQLYPSAHKVIMNISYKYFSAIIIHVYIIQY